PVTKATFPMRSTAPPNTNKPQSSAAQHICFGMVRHSEDQVHRPEVRVGSKGADVVLAPNGHRASYHDVCYRRQSRDFAGEASSRRAIRYARLHTPFTPL